MFFANFNNWKIKNTDYHNIKLIITFKSNLIRTRHREKMSEVFDISIWILIFFDKFLNDIMSRMCSLRNVAKFLCKNG